MDHQEFVKEPMGNKSVLFLPGIGKILGRKLELKDFDKAYLVLGQFLLKKKNSEMFTKWLKDTSGANAQQARACEQCLREWCVPFI
ncbi:barrier-to-autointegration factor-like isoform X2 [Sebastes umbrosus]|uniref:barrier-to-autointegration factor-like isoform X2 n=1 Tax=Sebastes umbrosus TaxID=72105 RepID=UPI0018A09A77|nr:barrier-to-autointegration factor-like isoform X2 [Sebastes umbrosus]